MLSPSGCVDDEQQGDPAWSNPAGSVPGAAEWSVSYCVTTYTCCNTFFRFFETPCFGWFGLSYSYSTSQSVVSALQTVETGWAVVCEGILNLNLILECYVWSSGNTQLALQIIKRNQLLPTTQQRVSPDFRKKPIQPLQLPSSFTQIQRKWATSPIPDHTSWLNLDIYEAVWTEETFDPICVGVKWPRRAAFFIFTVWGICVWRMKINFIYWITCGSVYVCLGGCGRGQSRIMASIQWLLSALYCSLQQNILCVCVCV